MNGAVNELLGYEERQQNKYKLKLTENTEKSIKDKQQLYKTWLNRQNRKIYRNTDRRKEK